MLCRTVLLLHTCARAVGVTARVVWWASFKGQTSKLFLCAALLLLHTCAQLLPCCAVEQQSLQYQLAALVGFPYRESLLPRIVA